MTLSRDEKMYFYDRFADQFDNAMNLYDTRRRLEVIFDELLEGQKIEGKSLLDAGCGTGWFSQWATERGAIVTSLDVGTGILGKVAEKCRTERVVGSICELNFKEGCFDVVLSSDVIEHTPDPRVATHELCRVLKPGGILVLTVPNKVWYFSLALANAVGIRPYHGYENWVGWKELKRWLLNEGMEIETYRGIHLFPFCWKFTYPLLRYFDKFGHTLGPFMINIAVRGKKT